MDARNGASRGNSAAWRYCEGGLPADHRDAGRKAFTIAERAEAYFAEGNKRARYTAGYRYM